MEKPPRRRRRRLEQMLDETLASRPVDVTLPRDRLPTRGLVRADVIAERLGVPEEHVKRHWKQYPFAVQVSERVIRYDPVAFDAFLDGLTQARR
jgi:hypothetical protein